MDIRIGKQKLHIKDYYCAGEDDVYLPREDGKLWLYIHLTNECNASCPFCVNAAERKTSGAGILSLSLLRECLISLSGRISGVSITGGEPMLYPDLTDRVAELVMDILPDSMLDLATNGTNLESILSLRTLDAFEGRLLSGMSDPAKIVLNCVMQNGLVDSEAAVIDYLEMAASAGVRNTSFIGMFKANDYCRENYLSPAILELKDPRFHVWNHYHDHDFCSCSSGSFDAEGRPVRFYYRCPGSSRASYTRQLVYTSDNRLLAGFGGEEIFLQEH